MTPAPALARLDQVQLVMGTGVRYALRGVPDPLAARAAVAEAVLWLERVDRVFSTYRDDSAVSRLRRDEPVSTEDDAVVEEVLGRCEAAWELTDGWFDLGRSRGLRPQRPGQGLVAGARRTAAGTGLCRLPRRRGR